MFRGLYLGFIRLHVLHHAVKEPIYGLAMIRELQRHGYTLSPGTMYPMLRDMETEGYLRREDRVIEGKVRKYYSATPEGARALDEARGKIAELAGEVIEGRGPATIAIDLDDPEEETDT